MIVRTNTMAINANSNLNKNNSAVSKNLEKLSSGYRINRAADDASGLAISEKMKAQIKALDTASANAQDGISLIQTAEGYMSEVHDMLNRMVELAEKSANGTMESGKATAAAAYSSSDTSKAGTDRAALQAEMDQLSAEIDRIADTANFNNIKLFNGNLQSGYTTVGGGSTTGASLTLQIGETSKKSDKLSVDINSLYTKDLFSDMTAVTVGSDTGVDLTVTNSSSQLTDPGFTINISDQNYASVAAEEIRKVINTVSSQRADLGAMQNRLDYTINNLNTASENMSSANSRIRDTDMAKTMMEYTQGNVLTQAAQAMLAQANQQPQNVLQLLQ
ncbi:MAG: flagellin [Oscillospiraceae bacterium]